MKSIIVVSPNYLEAIYSESKKYDFCLYGYGSFAKGLNGLLKVNSAEILGFAFVGVHLPSSRSKDFKPMLEFFHMCDIMAADKKFVIVTDEDFTPWLKIFRKYKNLRFYGASSYDFMSDIIINKNVFGSILLDNAEPYSIKKQEDAPVNWDTPHLEYVPLFPDTQIQCVSPVEILDTLERTLDNDSVYCRFKSEKAYLQTFRKYYISLLFGDNDSIIECKSDIEDIFDKQQSDAENFCALMAMKNYIEEVSNERISQSVSNNTGSP